MLGVQGRVTELLNPVGTISVDDNIDVDENVEIVGVDGLTLRVKRRGGS